MHPLDNPTWKALTTHQSQIALVAGMARRFPPEVAVHGALALPLPPAYQDLLRLSPEPVGLFSFQKLQPPPGWTVVRAVELSQMVQTTAAEGTVQEAASATTQEEAGAESSKRERASSASERSAIAGGFLIEDLTPADLPQMSALYETTRPGRKLSPALYKLGGFVGIRERTSEGKNQLVAMACLRLHLPGYREISTVGTLPGFEGRGYATALVRELARRIRARSEQPFLTVRTDNERAVAIYQRLGFRERVKMHSTTIRFG
ncbi:MAG: GNAT family N-acetyltransferase [Acidobacteriia bacterium]|nr:GNAT family N-acetyltransferase [Terriglobia bacterium]